jgi:HEAT repeat protein
MRSAFNWFQQLDPSGYVLLATIASAMSLALLLGFILARRAYRRRYFHRRAERTVAIAKQWESIVNGTVLPETWLFDRLDREIVESMLLDRLEVASPQEAERLVKCLRLSGLLDLRIYEAREFRGWRRRLALVSLGRMRAPETIPPLAEALDDPSLDARVDAVRGLGNTALPEAAVPILDRIVRGQLHVAVPPLQNALLNCCRLRPSLLLPYIREADDDIRPLLARVLAEVASPELGPELLQLASDPLSEVRASAARALGEAQASLALLALGSLVKDEEWFVRLRAVVALGQLDDPRTIPVLIETLCDSNRYVRVRSAWALARLDAHLEEIFDLAMRKRDRYALQALVSELERSGGIFKMIDALVDPARQGAAEQVLVVALESGTQRLLLDALVHHTEWHVRVAVAQLLARSGETQLIPRIERLEAAAKSWRQKRIMSWLLQRWRNVAAATPGPEHQQVIA